MPRRAAKAPGVAKSKSQRTRSGKVTKQAQKLNPEAHEEQQDAQIVDMLQEEATQADRGMVHGAIRRSVYAVGRLAKRGSRQAGELFSKLSAGTAQLESVSSMLGLVGRMLQGASWIGEFAFDYLFSLHPNILGPLVSVSLSAALGYMCGSFVGNMLWPDFWMSRKIWQIMSLGTNLSLLGGGTAVIAGTVGAYKLSRPIGELADLVLGTGSHANPGWGKWVLHKLALSVMGSVIVSLVLAGTPVAALAAFQSLSSALPQLPQLGMLGWLNLVLNLRQIKSKVDEKDYRGAVQTGAMFLIMQRVQGMIGGLFGGVEASETIVTDFAAETAKRLGEQAAAEAAEAARITAEKILETAAETPLATGTTFEVIATWLSTILNRIWELMPGPLGLTLAAILAGVFLCWRLWKRREAGVLRRQAAIMAAPERLAIMAAPEAPESRAVPVFSITASPQLLAITAPPVYFGCIDLACRALLLIKDAAQAAFEGKDVERIKRLCSQLGDTRDLGRTDCPELMQRLGEICQKLSTDLLTQPISPPYVSQLAASCGKIVSDANSLIQGADAPELNDRLAIVSQNVLTSINSLRVVQSAGYTEQPPTKVFQFGGTVSPQNFIPTEQDREIILQQKLKQQQLLQKQRQLEAQQAQAGPTWAEIVARQ